MPTLSGAFVRASVTLLIGWVAIFGPAEPAAAADNHDVGDRVEVDDLGNGGWRPGVVVAEDDRTYLVRMDPQDGAGFSPEYTVPKTGIYETRIRASGASLPAAQQRNESTPVGILDCPITEGIESPRLDEDVLAKLIRCLSEYKNGAGPTSIGTDSRFDITAMKVGGPRSWNVLNDVGPGTVDTQVYPVKVSYTQYWWSNENVITQNGIAIYGCYYSTLSEWICASNSSVKKDPMLVQPR